MKTLKFELEDKKVVAYIGGEEAGWVELSNIWGGCFQIELSQIHEKYRSQGLYRKLLVSCFELKNAEALISNKRNNIANCIYEQWAGKELDYETEVTIGYSNGSLDFYTE